MIISFQCNVYLNNSANKTAVDERLYSGVFIQMLTSHLDADVAFQILFCSKLCKAIFSKHFLPGKDKSGIDNLQMKLSADVPCVTRDALDHTAHVIKQIIPS